MPYWIPGLFIVIFAFIGAGCLYCCRRVNRRVSKVDILNRLSAQTFHDLKNILTGIQSTADVLAVKSCNYPELKGYADMVVKASSQALYSASYLLRLSGNKKKDLRHFSLNDCVRETEHLLECMLSEKVKLTICFNAQKDIIYGERCLVQAMLLNLCLNARDAMSKDGELRIITDNRRLEKADTKNSLLSVKPGNFVVLEICDNGCGIASELLPHIFKPYFTTKTQENGTGLGLSAVRDTAENHHAGLIVESKAGKGSSFKIYFPQCEDDQSIVCQKTECGRLSALVLIVDDEPVLREMLGEILSLAGITVLSAADGREALKIYARHPEIDAVVLDMLMPEMNGQEVYEALLCMNPELKAVFVSGEEESVARCHTAHCVSKPMFVRKPYHAEEVIDKLRLLLATEQEA